MKFISLFLMVVALVSHGEERLKVVTSTTDLAWAVQKIGGRHVDVTHLLKGTENPHYVDAIPEFIRLAADAQIVFAIGLDLEIGWLPKVLARSGNAQVQPGGKGYAEVGKSIVVLEKPVGGVDRSMGDVHPGGNPHFWISPKYFAQSAQGISWTLMSMDPAHTADYQAGLKSFVAMMDDLQKRSEKKLKPLFSGLQGPVMLEYHKEFTYFLETYGLKSLGSIEEKPGVAPSAGRLAEVALQAKSAGVRFALSADTAPKKTLERFQELSGVPTIQVPLSIVPQGRWKDYIELHEHIIDSIVQAMTASRKQAAR